MRGRSIIVLLSLGIAAGCGPRGASGPEPAPPAPPSVPSTVEGNAPTVPPTNAPSEETPGGDAPAPGAPGSKTPTAADTEKLKSLAVDRGTQISVPLPKQSLAVVEYYDRALAARGWKKREAKAEDDPGQREWLEMPVPAGPTDLYDAAWEHPKTGKTAVLNLFHTKEQPGIQQGTFEIHPKGAAPWK